MVECSSALGTGFLGDLESESGIPAAARSVLTPILTRNTDQERQFARAIGFVAIGDELSQICSAMILARPPIQGHRA